MEDSVSVRIVEADEVKSDWRLDWQLLGEEYLIDISEPGSGRSWSARGRDLFEAFCALRLRLEPLGIRICVNGARTDAYPSAMSRDMSGGQMLYLLRRHGALGRLLRLPALRPQKSVYIFSPAPCDRVGSVGEQRTYFEKWFDYEI